jgi:PPK2 family polyphosphate:nucleotide phosphotransferase
MGKSKNGGVSGKTVKKIIGRLTARPGRKVALEDYPTDWTARIDKKDAETLLVEGVKRLSNQQDRLYAEDTYSILLIFQAMDAAGKDGTIKHVMSGVNPQGCQVFSFKAPSAEERNHGYLWRSFKALPERGRIGIHNRSYYEEVLVTRVHPEILEAQQLPDKLKTKNIWKRRYEQINNFEEYLVANGTIPLKFYLHLSKPEQKKRFLARIDLPEKNWKFSVNDAKERALWDDYMDAFEETFTHTSTEHAPWYIVPADNKWFTRLAVAEIVNSRLEELKLNYPKVGKSRRHELQETRRVLMAEKS